jgi:hypothetical protein
MMKLKVNQTFLIQLLFLSLAGITAYQKISALAVPDWFIHKFEGSIIGLIPFGISLSFILITLLETSIAVCMIVSLVKGEYKAESNKVSLNLGLDLALILFLILFFGSFLVGDYENGALDFLYFIGTLAIRNKLVI